MIIEKIQLQNYRNYEFSTVEFFDGINFIEGKNVQGKTNLLEAIFYCSIGKSLRASREKEVIKFDSDNAKISLFLKKKYKKSQITIHFSKHTKKSIKINDIPIKKISELMGEFNAVYFSPDELKLIKEKPDDRRRFMDIHNSQMSKKYFYLISRYEKILANRNKLLKSTADKKAICETIEIWNAILADIGVKIILFRQRFLKKLTPYAEKVHSFLTAGKENLELEYTGFKNLLKKAEVDEKVNKKSSGDKENHDKENHDGENHDGENNNKDIDIKKSIEEAETNACEKIDIKKSIEINLNENKNLNRAENLEKTEDLNENLEKKYDFETLKNYFLTALRNSFEKDLNLKYTTFGPHRDDIKVNVNGIDVRAYGSQGQQRTAALSLKLAELEIMFLETKDRPVLLLDDVLSELDAERRHRLLKFCSKTQTFITGTEFPEGDEFNVYKVKNGTISLVKKNTVSHEQKSVHPTGYKIK